MNFKESLKLPKTEMPIKANLPANEPLVYAKWDEERVYHRMKRPYASMTATRQKGIQANDPPTGRFVLHDGPPYANGSIHIGHAMNKILKDFIVKQHFFQGEAVEFVPGWDCHGLPIEKKVMDSFNDEINAPNDDLVEDWRGDVVAVRRKCREYATEQVDGQRDEFKALGVIADWDRPYLTMDPKNESIILNALHNLAANHLLFQRQKPVHWSWAERTALAESEIEYKDRIDPSIYVAFKIQLKPDFVDKLFPGEYHEAFRDRYLSSVPCGLAVWTTTPWTLPSNAAVAIHPDEEYVGTWSEALDILQHSGGIPQPMVFVAKKRFDALVEKGILKPMEPHLCTVTGKELAAGISNCYKPFGDNRVRSAVSVPVVCDKFVDVSTGTGCVHIAPGHGEIDYQIGQKHGLPVIQPVDDAGCWTKDVYTGMYGLNHNVLGSPPLLTRLEGKHVLEFGNKFIVESLRTFGYLLHEEEITHSYPHCWRSGEPVIFRATDQWFMDLQVLRPAAIDAVENTTFIPETAKNRLLSMVRDREDWCLSRQRSWGVPIAFLRNKKTGRVWFFDDILSGTSSALSHGMEDWWDEPVDKFLPEHYKYKPEDFEKITDILDVWFDSGMSWRFLNSLRTCPADVYCEGNDQHRGWFQSSLWLSLALSKSPPFKKIISHGFVVDENGEKMAKSKGNVVSPQVVLKKYGAEVLRYWVATTDYTREMRLSEPILKRCVEGYRKLRNTLRYLVANLDDAAPSELTELLPVDYWIFERSKKVFDEVHQLYGEYDFCRGTHMLNDFIHAELSGIWMSAAKDRLYCGDGVTPHPSRGHERDSAQYVISLLLRNMLSLVAPLFTYTAEEVLGHCPEWFRQDVGDFRTRPVDVFDLKYVSLENVKLNQRGRVIDDTYWREALDGFNLTFDQLKKEGKVRDKLEVVVESLNQKSFMGVEDWYGVSAYRIPTDANVLAAFEVQGDEHRVVLSDNEKCSRCWKRVVVSPAELCPRCSGVVDAYLNGKE